MSNTIKIILSILLFLCLAKMSYGYDKLMRTIIIVGFIILGYKVRLLEHKIETIIYFSLVLLFQPFFKIALGRELWIIVDIVVSIGLILSMYVKSREKHQKE